MASVRARLEEVSSDDDDSSSLTAYTTFNSLGTEDSLEQIRRSKNSDINGDPGYYQRTDSEVEERPAWHGKFKPCCFKCMDITVTVVVIFLIWMVMALPTAFYVYTQLKNRPHDNLENATCTLYDSNTNECTAYLQQYAKCLNNDSYTNNDIYISPLNEMAVGQASDYVNFLNTRIPQSFVSEQCMMTLEPLICLYFVHVCYKDNDSFIDVGPSERQCTHIKEVCDQELKMAGIFGYTEFTNILLTCAQQSPLDNRNCRIQPNTRDVNITLTNCSEGFYRNTNGSCLPECAVWSPYPQTTVLITDILVIFSTVVAVVSGVAVLFVSCVRCQKMYRYPSIFVVYQTIPTILIAVLILIGFSARRQLFCRSQDLQESVQHPSSFCILTGVLFYYVMMHLLLWWLWHTIAVFWAVAWPFHARKFNSSRNTKYPHIAFALASLLLPIAPVLIILLVTPSPAEKSLAGFTITRAPPFVCAGYDINTNFWAFIFPISILLATGVTLLVLILRIVIRKHVQSKIHKIRVNLNWALELKVLFVLVYYVIIGAAVLTIFTMALTGLQEFIEKLFFLTACESKGIQPGSEESSCTEEREDLQRFDNPYPTIVAIIVLGFLPAVNLIYIVKVKEVVNKLKCCRTTRKVQYVERESSRSSRYIPYQVQREAISTTLRHGSLTIHTRTVNNEPLISSESNSNLRQQNQ